MGLWVEAACGCHKGQERKNNEDNLYFSGRILEEQNLGLPGIRTLERNLENGACFAVFDGMGGETRGEHAAFLAAEILREMMRKKQNYFYDLKKTLLELFDDMNKAVYAENSRFGERMGSTSTVLLLEQDTAALCNIGDSPAFLLRDGRLYPIFERQIEMTISDWNTKQQKQKTRLIQYLGVSPDEATQVPYLDQKKLYEGDLFLLCSDGLTDVYSGDALRKKLINCSNLKQGVAELLDGAEQQGSWDDITVILLRIFKMK